MHNLVTQLLQNGHIPLFTCFHTSQLGFLKLAVMLSWIEGVHTKRFRLAYPLVIDPPLGML